VAKQRKFLLEGNAQFPSGTRETSRGFVIPRRGVWTPVLALYNADTNETITGEAELQDKLGIVLVGYTEVQP